MVKHAFRFMCYLLQALNITGLNNNNYIQSVFKYIPAVNDCVRIKGSYARLPFMVALLVFSLQIMHLTGRTDVAPARLLFDGVLAFILAVLSSSSLDC